MGRIRIIIVASICFALSLGCKDKEATPTSPQTNNAVKAKPNTNSSPVEAPEVVEETPPKPFKFSRVITPIPDFETYSFQEPIGKISGEIYGKDRPLMGIARARCGDGSVIQAIYQGDKGLNISSPMPIRYLGLATKKTVRYTEGDFNVALNFSDDSPEKLKGMFQIMYKEEGVDKTFVDISVDGKPIAHLYPPKLSGKGEIPMYGACVPTGYFKAEVEGLPVMYGYVHTTNVNGVGVPKTRVLFSEQYGIDLFVIPLKKGRTFSNAKISMETSRIKGKHPAVVQADVFRLAELIEPTQATGSNLDHLITEPVLEGMGILSLKKDSVTIQIDDFTIGETLKGPFDGRKVKSLRVESAMAPDDAMTFKMPDPPEWWKDE